MIRTVMCRRTEQLVTKLKVTRRPTRTVGGTGENIPPTAAAAEHVHRSTRGDEWEDQVTYEKEGGKKKMTRQSQNG
eukprot:g23629.t1